MNRYIHEKIKEIKAVYKRAPDRILSDYGKEEASIQEYHGRELLELLQNAVDEIESANDKSVCIEFAEDILKFSNNGEVFSEDGLRSLLYPNFSPKRKKPNYIGSKGTGFRSVLNWADCVRIYSGSLSVEFSSANAEELLKDLLKSQKVSSYREIHPDLELKVATLFAPKIINPLAKEEIKFDTVIELYIKDDMAKNVRDQMDDLEPKTMLFLDNLEKLTIICDGEKREYLKKKPIEKSDIVVITTYINDKKTDLDEEWKVVTDKGKIEDFNDKGDKKSYSVAIAYKPDLSLSPDFLYSFFIMKKIIFPFPVLANGTFDLNANRNDFNEKQTLLNKKVLEKICLLLIDTAFSLCKNGAKYCPLKLLILQGRFPRESPWDEIEAFYYNAVAQSKVFPTVNKKYISFDQNTKFYEGKIANFLEGEGFKNLLLYSDDDIIVNFIMRLAVRRNKDRLQQWGYTDTNTDEEIDNFIKKRKGDNIDLIDYLNLKYEYDDIVHSLNALLPSYKTKARIKDRVALCLEFINEYGNQINRKAYSYFPAFFLDSSGKKIDGNQNVFLHSDALNEEIPSPPKFAHLNFMGKDLHMEFRNHLGGCTDPELAEKLSLLMVKEYDLEEIIESTVSRFNDIAENKKADCCVELINWLWDISLPDGIYFEIPMLTRNGTNSVAKKLYFGKEYGNDITENLFPDRDDFFIAPPGMFDFQDEEIHDVCEFLEKIGVSKFPRIIPKIFQWSLPDKYKEQIVSDFEYPLIARDKDTVDLNENAARNASFSVTVKEIENYDCILGKADTIHILEWLMADLDARTLVTSKFEKPDSEYWLQRKGDRQRKIINNKISCYMRFKFSHNGWIKIDGKSEPYAPKQCLLRSKIGNKLSKYLIEPDFEIYAKKLNTSSSEIEELFRGIGVMESFGDLSTNSLYGILLLLPGVDEKGDISKSLYKSVLKKDPIGIDKTDEKYKEFMRDGKVFCRHINRYEPIDNVRYLARENISNIVIKASPYFLIDIQSKKNQDYVEKYFGVKKLALSGKITGEPIIHKLNGEFETDFGNFKAYAFCYIVGEDAGDSEKSSSIKELRVVICEEITADYGYGKVSLEDYAFISGNDRIVYTKMPAKITTMEKARADVVFCNTIAEIITGTVDIQDEEKVKSIRQLYEKDESDRQELIRLDLGERQILDEARYILGTIKPARELFALACRDIGGFNTLPDKIIELSDKIDFININKISNAENLLRIMHILDIDIPEFNKKSNFDEIDIRQFYMKEFDELTKRYKNEYKDKLFTSLKGKDLKAKEKFVENYLDFEHYEFSPENSKEYKVNEEFFKRWNILKLEVKVEGTAVGQYEQNRKKFLEKEEIRSREDRNILNELLDDYVNRSLMYFGELDILSEKYEKVRERERRESIEDAEPKTPNIPSNPIQRIEVTTVPDNIPSRGKEKNRKSRKPTRMKSDHEKEKQGADAEIYAYARYRKDGYNEVEWVSGNAFDEGKPDGDDTHGYDMTYKDKDGKTVFVEVKSTQGESFVFTITQHELDTAEEKVKDGGSYEIALVINADNEKKRDLIIFPKLFVYENGKDFYTTGNFTAVPKTEYKIIVEKQADIGLLA